MPADPATSNPPSTHLEIHIDVAQQTLHLLSNGALVKSWPVSTSKFGLGFEPGSFKTPLGHFQISEKIGKAAPPWSIFKNRLPTGQIGTLGGEEDMILSRILWLEGLDSENANTKERYIYIHGTNQEDLIGQAASHGCIRLRNQDIIELFDRVPIGTLVSIS